MNLLGCIPSPHDDRDVAVGTLRLSSFRSGRDQRAPISLRVNTPGVLDQSITQACVGFSTAVAYYCAARTRGMSSVELPSPMAIYALSRHQHVAQNAPLRDTGSYLRSALKALTKHGVPTDRAWPFDPGRINERPPWSVMRSGIDARGPKGYFRSLASSVDMLDELDDALAEGYPFVTGTRVDRAFQQASGPAYIDRMGSNAELTGGHAMACIGRVWRDGVRWYEVQNSWGPTWRDAGFAWLHEQWILDGFEAWVVVP